jgi:nitroreductase
VNNAPLLLPLSVVLLTTLTLRSGAAEFRPPTLPPPLQTGGPPLLQALAERKTTRDFRSTPLSAQQLSDVLWAGFGINRPESGGRTAPSALNSQEIDLYVATAEGVFLYVPKAHRLEPVLAEDVRALTGGQPFVTTAPVILLFIADLTRMAKAKPDQRERYAAIDTGCICQNVALWCTAADLGTVVHEVADRKTLAGKLLLRSDQKIILAQTIGHPRP